ncbi:MAG TPA: Gfo/Idh/MocA family oxidoreductase [Solirubrobacter sp.]|nr:Gfo/Idh/MocA family oxidoreductase [Solirubrobacter sp.]
MTPTRIGVVGAGRAGAVHARNIHGHTPDAEVACVIDPDLGRARELAAELGAAASGDLAAALAEHRLDAVAIATPTFGHRDLAVTAAEHGAHVFIEKPLALTLAECDDIIAAAERAGVILQVGFVRRYQPEFAEAHARVEAGEIGDVMVIKSLTRGPGLPPAWAHDIALSNGMLAEVNSHDFDSVRWLAGSDIERVYTEVANRKGERFGVTAEHFYDNAVVSLRFADGALGTVDGACPAEYGYDARVEILGTKGLLVIGEVSGSPLLMAVDRAKGGNRPVHKTWPDRFPLAYMAEMRAFVDAVRGGGEAEVTGLDGRRAVQAVVAANRSWMQERPVRLDEVEGA